MDTVYQWWGTAWQAEMPGHKVIHLGGGAHPHPPAIERPAGTGEEGTRSEVTLRIDHGRSLLLFLGGHGIAGHGGEHFLAQARYPGQALLAGSAQELEELLERAVREETRRRGDEPG